jgi:hypothetical protein
VNRDQGFFVSRSRSFVHRRPGITMSKACAGDIPGDGLARGGVDQPHTKHRLRRRVSPPVNGLALRGDRYEGGIVRLSSAPSAAEVNDSRAINSIVGQF